LVFSQTVEGLFRALGPLDGAAREKFRAIGIDPGARLEPAYPVDQYVAMQKVAVEVFAPDLPFSLGIETLGRRFVDGYGETIVGKAVLVTMKLLGPKRTLERLSRTLSTGSSFFETKLSEFSPGVWHLWLNRVTFPGWYVGLIRRGLELAGAKGVELKVLQHDGAGLGLTLEVRWR
jgi:uncharacterized protein (TIGR02265 family)